VLKRKKKAYGSRRVSLDDASAESYVAGLVAAAAEIRLPGLFAKPHRNAILSVQDRGGITTTALRTTDLTEEQLVELMRFRLAQYLEVNFVEPTVVYEQRLEHESLDNVYPNDVHVVAGSVDEGEILCYATLKSAPDAPPGTTLRTRDRPLLPVEKSHGYGIFNRLPILPDLPVAQIRELGRFVKNQRYHGVEDRSVRGPVEVGTAIFRMIAETLSFELSAVVGDLEEAVAKQNLDFFRIPLVVLHGTMPVESDDSWLFPRYLQRNVNPFALLASDAAAAIPRLDEIENCLGRPGKLGLLSLMRLRNAGGAAEVRSSLEPKDGISTLADTQLPQVEMAMAERRQVREAGDRLRETPIFEGLSDAEASVLATFMEAETAEPGTVIVRQGDEADALYFVQSGEVEVRLRAADGTSTAVARIGTGDYFGEIGVLTGGARLADVVALEPTELLRLSKADYERYLTQVVEVDQELGKKAMQRAGDSARRLSGGK
jgi:Cyclic nucleotide-binding domain